MNIHPTLPEDGCYLVRYPAELYRLLPRKRQLYSDNREYRYGIRYLVFSFYSRRYYERILSDSETEENLVYFIQRKMIWLWPQEEFREEIKAEVEKSGLKYYELMWRRHNEMLFEEIKGERNDGNGYKYWLQYRRGQIDKLKVKPK